jgi:hypothetical protein
MTGAHGHFAYINQHFVTEGDTMNGYTVVSINAHSVVLRNAREVVTLSVAEDIKR